MLTHTFTFWFASKKNTPMRELAAARLLLLCQEQPREFMKGVLRHFADQHLDVIRFFMGRPATAVLVRKHLLLHHEANATKRCASLLGVSTANLIDVNNITRIWGNYAKPAICFAVFCDMSARVRNFRARHSTSVPIHWSPGTYFYNHTVDFTQ